MNEHTYFGLFIGVGDDLPITVKDAKDLAQLFTDPSIAAFPEENVTVLTENQANKQNVIKALEDLRLKTQDQDNATVIIYYSGHGGQFKNPEKEEEDYYLITHGLDFSRMEETILNGKIFSNLVNSISASKLLVVLDCCHAAGMISDGTITKATGPLPNFKTSNIQLIDTLTSGEGRVFLSSCDDYEQSVVLPNSKNSLFTEVMLEALQGAARPQVTNVSLSDVMGYVLYEVPERLDAYNKTQNPVASHKQRPMVSSAYRLSSDFYISRSKHSAQTNPGRSISDSDVTQLIKTHDISNSYQPVPIQGNADNLDMLDELKSTIELARKQIINGQTNKAIKTFLAITETFDTDYRDASILLANQYNTALDEKMKALITDANYQTRQNQLNQSINYFLGKML